MVYLGLPIKNGGIFHGYVSQNQRVSYIQHGFVLKYGTSKSIG